jgi:hypothetical protein
MGEGKVTVMSNRDRVGRGLEILADGLHSFVDTRMAAAAPGGQNWVEVLTDPIQPGTVTSVAIRCQIHGFCFGW